MDAGSIAAYDQDSMMYAPAGSAYGRKYTTIYAK